jgi:hypothetical protein
MAKVTKIDLDKLSELSRQLIEMATRIKTFQEQREVVMTQMEENDADFKAGEISKKVYDNNLKDMETEKQTLEVKVNDIVDNIIVNVLKKQVEIVDSQSIGAKKSGK